MKKIFFFILLFVCFQSYGQRFPSVDSLQNYILRYIRNSTVESFTNLRMQNVVYGLSELLESRAVDSIWRVAGKDSIFFRKNGTTFKIKDSVGTGGGGGSLTLQQVTDNGATTTNGISFVFSDNHVIDILDEGSASISVNKSAENKGIGISKDKITFDNGSFNYSFLTQKRFNRNNPIENYYQLPLTRISKENDSLVIPLSIRLNNTTYLANDTGSIELGNIKTITGNSLLGSGNINARLDIDTIPIATFTVGSAAAGDTSAFSTSTLAGSFYLDGTDTLFITSYRVAVQGTSASITPDVWFNDSLNITAGGTKLVTSPSAITNTTTGTSVTPNTNKIPQGNWVFVRFSAVATKPTYFTLTLFGYRIRKA